MTDRVELVCYHDHMRHLVCVPYSIANLHTMANQLGIKRCWYHAGGMPHYDIPKKDISRINDATIRVNPREIVRIVREEIQDSEQVRIIE